MSVCEDVSVRVSDCAGAGLGTSPHNRWEIFHTRNDLKYFTAPASQSESGRADLHCQQQWCFYWSDNE